MTPQFIKTEDGSWVLSDNGFGVTAEAGFYDHLLAGGFTFDELLDCVMITVNDALISLNDKGENVLCQKK